MVKLEIGTQYGCLSSKSKTVHVNPKAKPLYNSDVSNGCPPLCVNFKNLSQISTGKFTSTWDFGDLSPVIVDKDPSHCFNSGGYDLVLKLTSDSGCISELKHAGYIAVYDNPVGGFRVEPEEINEDEPTITVSSTANNVNYVKYYINDGSSYGTRDFTHNLRNLDGKTKPMIVQVVRNQNGCADTVYDVLNIKPAFTIYFPNVFTPNGDGINDTFMPKGTGIIKFGMEIFDRWGATIFSTGDFGNCWNGKYKGDEVKQDVYTWKAQVVDIFNKKHEFVGRVSVIK
jgi:gliding motility-associated-like protein